jgi:transposase InsO family protein
MRRTISADIEIRAIARPDLRAELNPRGVKDRMCRLFRRMDRDTRLKEHLLRVNKKKKKRKKKRKNGEGRKLFRSLKRVKCHQNTLDTFEMTG